VWGDEVEWKEWGGEVLKDFGGLIGCTLGIEDRPKKKSNLKFGKIDRPQKCMELIWIRRGSREFEIGVDMKWGLRFWDLEGSEAGVLC